MNRLDIRAKARAITELTVDDVADDIIDLYARDGYERIINMERRWPFFEATWELSTTASVGEYVIDTEFTNLREIVAMTYLDTGVRLDLIGYEQGEAVWLNTTDGRPQHWSTWSSAVKLWPTPDQTYTLRVRGYRKAEPWWDADATEIDADERLHAAVLYYVISKLYQLQEDVEMSNMYASTFAEAARAAHADIMRPPSMRPLVLNQGVPFGPNSFTRFF